MIQFVVIAGEDGKTVVAEIRKNGKALAHAIFDPDTADAVAENIKQCAALCRSGKTKQ
jgi:hypothetical protein